MSAEIGALHGTLGLNSTSFNEGLGRAQKRMNGFKKSMRNMGKNFKKVGRQMSVGLTAPIVAGFAGVVKSSADFEQSMNRVAALSGATGASFDALRDQAKQLGATTQFSASQAADAMGFLAMAGFDAEKVIGAMPSTLRLASAAQLDLASSADIVSNIMSGFGHNVDELPAVVDILTKSFTSANTDLVQLGDAMKYVGPVAKSAGIRFTETAAAISLLANAGIQGEMGGTALRGILVRLQSDAKPVVQTMKELGVNVFKSNGRLKDISEIMKEFAPHAENGAAMMKIFGQRAGPAMQAMLLQGSDALVKLDQELQNAGGTAEKIANKQMEGFNGAVKGLRSAIEGLAIAIGDSGVLEFMTDLVARLTAMARSLAETSPRLLKMGVIAASVAAAIGPLLIAFGFIMTALAPIAGALALVISPLVLLAAAVATAGVAIYSNWGSLKEDFPAITGTIEFAINGLIVVFNKLKEIAVLVATSVGEHFRLMAEGLEALLSGDFKGALDVGVAVFQNFGDMLFNLADTILQGMLTKGLEIGGNIVDGIKQGFAKKWETLKVWFTEKIDQMPQWVRKAFGIHSPSKVFAEIGGFIVDGLAGGISGGFGKIEGVMSGLTDSLVLSDTIDGFDGLTDGLDGFAAKSETVFAKFGKLIANGIDQGQSLKETLSGIFSNIGQNLLSSGLSGLGGALFGGGGSSLLSGVGGLLGFKDGGSFNVGGTGGIDSQLVAFKASPNENVHITKPNQSIGGGGGGATQVTVVPSPMFEVVVKQIAQSEAADVSGRMYAEGQRMQREGARRK